MSHPSDIVFMPARDLAKAIDSRRISCRDTMAAFLDHIEGINPQVNAIVALRERSDLLAEAEAHDAMLARGERKGPLHGLPLAVKDLQWVKGVRSTSGSPLFKDFVPNEDALLVERMRAAGAIIIGKTNTPEFGLGSHTYNPVYGTTLNAWDQTKSAGGSSGGAAVALATRMLPLADGSDYGGSLRNPAGWNHVCGFRPSYGVVPSAGEDVWIPTMGVAGPMARDVEDLALLLSVQAGYDARAPLSQLGDGSRFHASLEASFKGKRVAWAGDFGGWAPYEPGVLARCREALKAFASLGCPVEEAYPQRPLEPVWQAFLRLRHFHAGSGLKLQYDDPAKRPLLKPEARWEVEEGLKLTAYDAMAASMVRTQWSREMARFFERYDFLVMPTAQVFPFDARETWPREIAGQTMRTYHEWMKAVCLVSMAGCPSLAVPAGFNAQGLPMGLQIVAPIHRDVDCLRMGFAYEQARPWIGKLPPLLLA